VSALRLARVLPYRPLQSRDPPAVGEPDTIAYRTGLFFLMMLISLGALIFAVAAARRLALQHGGLNATLAGAGLFIGIMGEPLRTGLWMALVAACTVIGSLAFACAAPLIDVATLPLPRRALSKGSLSSAWAWLANQLVGYLVVGYPQTWDSFGWGAVIGIATALGFVGAVGVSRLEMPSAAMAAIGLTVAFLVYEAKSARSHHCPAVLE